MSYVKNMRSQKYDAFYVMHEDISFKKKTESVDSM